MTLRNTESIMLTQGNISNAFKVGRGLRQKVPLSALLFNLALEIIYERAR